MEQCPKFRALLGELHATCLHTGGEASLALRSAGNELELAKKAMHEARVEYLESRAVLDELREMAAEYRRAGGARASSEDLQRAGLMADPSVYAALHQRLILAEARQRLTIPPSTDASTAGALTSDSAALWDHPGASASPLNGSYTSLAVSASARDGAMLDNMMDREEASGLMGGLPGMSGPPPWASSTAAEQILAMFGDVRQAPGGASGMVETRGNGGGGGGAIGTGAGGVVAGGDGQSVVAGVMGKEAEQGRVGKGSVGEARGSCLLGVDGEWLLETHLADGDRALKVGAAIPLALIPELEARLRRKTERLAQLVAAAEGAPALTAEGADPAASHVEDIPARIAVLADTCRKLCEATVHADHVQAEREFAEHHKVLMEVLDLLQFLIKRWRMAAREDVEKVLVEWLPSFGKTLHSKLRVLEHKLLVDTYNERTMPALLHISNYLRRALDDATQSYEKLTTALREYEGIDADFDKLAQEYASVCLELAERKKLLAEVQAEASLRKSQTPQFGY
eukprot:jgi/Mesvir1/18653/Mv17155-RA.1